ncbi:MAG: hypothetical protein E7469_04110 [Ruminococcaceae bacterium]|nr:hypothetical protein [Oscillospiraceae bacterium]
MENEVQKKGKKKLLIPLLLLLLLLVGGGVFAATQLLGGGAKYGPEVDVSDFQTLKEAIETTEEGQTRTLTLLNDIYMEDTITLPEGVVINLKDDGTSRSLVRDLSDSWMFWVPEESTLNIAGSKAEGVVLDGASGTIKAGPDGALIIAEYGTITLDNVLMKDNRSNQGLGGMMRLVGCDLTATNSTFTNGAGKSGGVVYAVESNVSFTDCDLSKNSSTVGHGGAVYVDNASELTLERCTLNNNEILTGAGYGGAVIVTNFSHATINDCTMDNNVLDHDGFANGGAMYIAWGSVVDVTNTTFNNNSVTGTENHLGGAIYINEGSTVNVGEGVKFIGNKASHGGAIYAIDTATVNLDGAYFEDNHTTIGNGGAIYCWRDPVLNAKNCTFIKNYTKAEGNAYGGAVALATGAPVGTIENCTFEGNYTDNVGFCNGGALLVGEGSEVTLLGNNVFKDNWGKSTGGKNTCGGAVYVSKASLTIEDGTSFVGNYGSHGGAIYVNYAGLLVMDGTKFDKNYSYYGHAGALCAWNGGEVEAKNCSFTNNYIKSDKGGYGGAVAIYNKDKEEYNSVGTFNNCTFINNKTYRTSGESNANGGAIYAGMGGDVYINGGTFKNNSARTADLANTKLAWRGGAIYSNTNSTLKVNGASFSGNSGQFGGAIFAQESAVLSVTNSTFTGNNTTDKGSHGGAIYVNRMPATISGCKFTDNWAQGIAGAVMLNGKENTMGAVTIKNCTFTGNHTPARTGGAVAAYDAIKLEITGSTFTGNYTNSSHGGAVYTQNMPAVIKSSTFTGNYIDSNATGYGGAVAIVNDSSHFEQSTGAITDCTFDGNYVVRTEGTKINANGGAVYFGLYTKATVDGNTSFTNNYAKAGSADYVAYGGGLYLNTGCSLIVADTVTFTGNSAQRGGAIGIGGAAAAKTVVNLNGPTLTGNTATEYGAGVYFDSYADLSVNGITITPAEGDQVADILIKKGLKLDLQGKVNIGTVAYEDATSLIHLDAALAEGSAITIIPAEYKEGLQVITAEEVVVDNGDGTQTTVNLLKDIKNIITVAKPADATEWIVGDDGKLEDRTPSVRIGEKEYATLVEALAEAKEGDLIELFLDDTVKADATVPAGATIWSNGKTLSVNDGVTFTLSDGVIIDGVAKIDGDVTVGNVDLTKTPVTGKVTVAEGKTLTVGGDFTAEEVHLLAGAKVNVATALTNAPAFLLTSAVETVDTVLVTAPDAEAVKAAVAAVEPFLKDSAVALGEEGKIIADATVATITKDGVTTKYDTIDAAIAAAADSDTIVIVKSFELKSRICAENGKVIIIDGNGKTLIRHADLKTTMLYAKTNANLTAKNLILDSNGVALKEAVVINKATMTLDNVTVMDANNAEVADVSKGLGGAVYTTGDMTVVNSTFTGNLAKYGGAFYIEDVDDAEKAPVVTITGSTFTNNKSTSHGGAFEIVDGDVTLDNCVLDNNDSTGGKAGGIHVGLDGQSVRGSKVTIKNSTIKNSDATGGGAAYFNENGSKAVFVAENTVFEANKSNNGGAIYNHKTGTATLTGCTFKNNIATNNGVVSNQQTMTVTNCVFEGNTGKAGGALYNNGILTITGGTFTKNSASDAGGVLFQQNTAGVKTTITGGTYTENTATNRGGAFYNHTSTALVLNETEENKLVVSKNKVTNTAAGYGGGAIWTNGGALSIDVGTFEGNSATYGGVVFGNGNVTITGGAFSNNSATYGGVVYMYTSKAAQVLTISGGTFTGNTAAKQGGAVYAAVGTTNISGGTFTGNSSTSIGGAVYVAAGKANVSGGTFTGNHANDAGGALGVYTVDFTVSGGTFTGNTAKNNGGAAYIGGGAKKLTVSGGTFENNTVVTEGRNADISVGYATGGDSGGALVFTEGNTAVVKIVSLRENATMLHKGTVTGAPSNADFTVINVG